MNTLASGRSSSTSASKPLKSETSPHCTELRTGRSLLNFNLTTVLAAAALSITWICPSHANAGQVGPEDCNKKFVDVVLVSGITGKDEVNLKIPSEYYPEISHHEKTESENSVYCNKNRAKSVYFYFNHGTSRFGNMKGVVPMRRLLIRYGGRYLDRVFEYNEKLFKEGRSMGKVETLDNGLVFLRRGKGPVGMYRMPEKYNDINGDPVYISCHPGVIDECQASYPIENNVRLKYWFFPSKVPHDRWFELDSFVRRLVSSLIAK